MGLTPEWRFSLYYAALFASIGSIGPFFAVWLDSQGIDARTIGIIVAAPSIAMLLTTVRIGRWADEIGSRRTAIITGNALVLAAQLVFFWPLGAWTILAIWTFSGIIMFAKVPITDAAAISLTEQRNTDFARVRVFGSIGFVVALILSGMVYERLGMMAFVPILLLGNILRLWLAIELPTVPRRQTTNNNLNQANALSESQTSLYQVGILLTIFASALINASHAVFNTFGILLWTQQGLSETTASLLVGIGVIAEILLMWRFKSLTRRISARTCLVIAAICGIVRWSLLGLAPATWLVFVVQALHGITFGLTYLATASFIARRVGETNAARGQALSATVMTGLMAAMVYVSGYYFDALGMKLYWIMSGLCALSIVLILASYKTSLDKSSIQN